MSMRAISISGLEQEPPLTTGATEITALIADNYDYTFWSSVETYIKIGPANAAPVTESNGYVIYPNEKTYPIHVTEKSTLRAMSATGGTLHYMKVGRVR